MSRFVFTTQNADGTDGLYASDGTPTGTTDLNAAAAAYLQLPSFGFSPSVFFAGRTIFLGNSGLAGAPQVSTYSTDGTAGGTHEIFGNGVAYVLGNQLLAVGYDANDVGFISTCADGLTFN